MVEVSKGSRLTGFSEPEYYFNSIDEFIYNFPLAERQCIFQIEHELKRNGQFIFSDNDCQVDFRLTVID